MVKVFECLDRSDFLVFNLLVAPFHLSDDHPDRQPLFEKTLIMTRKAKITYKRRREKYFRVGG